MDPVTYGGLVTILCGAISTLFWLYVRELQRQRTKLEAENKDLTVELKATTLKVEETVRNEQDATRQELAELRKTNAALIATLSGKEITT